MLSDKSVRKSFLIVSAIFIFLNNITAITGFIITPPEMIFTGARWANSQDLHHYYSIMEQAQRGETRIIYPFTFEGPQKRLSVRPLYQLLGYIEKLIEVRHAALFRIVCAIMGALLIFSVWWFIGLFFVGEARMVGMIVVLFSSGYFIWVPESITFTAAADSPHMGYSLVSIMLTIGLSYKYSFLNANLCVMAVSGIILFLLGFIHPFDVVSAGFITAFILFSAVAFRTSSIKRSFKGLAVFSSIGLPSSVYVLWTTYHDPILKVFREICIVKSLSLGQLIFTYGLLLIFAVYGFIRSSQINKIEKYCLSTWIIITLILLHLPIKFQGRFIAGFHLPISILATHGILQMIYLAKLKPLKGKGLLYLIIIIFFLFYGNLNHISININEYRSQKYPYYISKDFLCGAEWLRKNSKPKNYVLTGVRTANILPAYAGNPVPWGNKYYTFLGSDRKRWQKLINSQMTLEEEHKFFAEKGVCYIFLDDLSRDDVLKEFNPLKRDYLIKVFSKGKITIWQIDSSILYQIYRDSFLKHSIPRT